MQIAAINYLNTNAYRYECDKNKQIHFRSSLEKKVSPELIAKLRSSMTEIHERSTLNDVNKYETPKMLQRAGSRFFHIVNIPSCQLQELLGDKGEKHILSLLEGICLVLNDNEAGIINSNISENILCLFPSNSPNVSYSELLLKGVLD